MGFALIRCSPVEATSHQPAPSSVRVTQTPRVSQSPSTFTPVAATSARWTIRPPSRTFWTAGRAGGREGLPSSGRLALIRAGRAP